MHVRWSVFGLAAILGVALCGQAQYADRDYSPQERTSAKAPAPEDRIDVNHASMKQLLKVPGMTQTWAARIVRFRPYHTKLDLLERGVVSSEVYDRIQDYIIAHKKAQ